MGAAVSSFAARTRARSRPPPPPSPPPSPSEYTLRAMEWQQLRQTHGPESPEFTTFAHRAHALGALEGRIEEPDRVEVPLFLIWQAPGANEE